MTAGRRLPVAGSPTRGRSELPVPEQRATAPVHTISVVDASGGDGALRFAAAFIEAARARGTEVAALHVVERDATESAGPTAGAKLLELAGGEPVRVIDEPPARVAEALRVVLAASPPARWLVVCGSAFAAFYESRLGVVVCAPPREPARDAWRDAARRDAVLEIADTGETVARELAARILSSQ